MAIVDLGNNIYQIDVYGMNLPGYTSVYLVKGEKGALIETGATPGIEHIFSAFQQLNIAPADIGYVVVTHVHLDHSGGAGALVRELPEAKVVVHPRGVRHLIEPARLCAAVRVLYGDVYDEYFGEVVPVAAERVYSPADGEKLDLGAGRVLTFYHTLGHARHHMVISDSLSGGLFSGDALGIRYHLGDKFFVFPITPPPEFDLEGCLDACRLVRQLSPEQIYFTHFGRETNVSEAISAYERLVKREVDIAREVISGGGTLDLLHEKLGELMFSEMFRHGLKEPKAMTEKRVSESLSLNAKGLLAYLGKKSQNNAGVNVS